MPLLTGMGKTKMATETGSSYASARNNISARLQRLYHTRVFQGVKSNRTMYCSAKLGPLSNIINKYLVPTESHFYFRFTGAIFFFYGDHYLSVSGIRPLDWALRNVCVAAKNPQQVVPNGRFYYFRS